MIGVGHIVLVLGTFDQEGDMLACFFLSLIMLHLATGYLVDFFNEHSVSVILVNKISRASRSSYFILMKKTSAGCACCETMC